MRIDGTIRELRRCAAGIEAEWKKHDHKYEAFPDIVLKNTESLDARPLGDLESLCALLNDPEIAALQATNTFSDLYVKLFDNGQFWIEVLNWWNSDINIHDHDFAAVQFQARGRSLNVKYEFSQELEIDEVRFGDLRVVGSEMWNENGRSITMPGSPHTVKHLSVPTVSVLIRTHPNAKYGFQHNYFPPGVVGNYQVANIVFRKNIKALRLLSRGESDVFHSAFRSFISKQNLAGALFTFIKMIDIVFDERHVNLIRDYAADGKEVKQRVIEAVAYYRATDILLKRVSESDRLPEHDIAFLAVLACSYDPESFSAIVNDLYGINSERRVTAALHDLTARLHDEEVRHLKNTMELLGLRREWRDLLEPAKA